MPKNRPKKRHTAAPFALLLSSDPEVRRSYINVFKQAIQTETVLSSL
jgi:spore coat protein CotF